VYTNFKHFIHINTKKNTHHN